VTDEAKGLSDPLVGLARRAIEAYVREGVVIETPEPHRTTLEDEIIANAVCAATQDPRFYPLEKHELESLDISVDVLGPPEEVNGLDELDPKRYGVIVRTIDGRRALLLPDLEGVDTVEQQLRICCRKGGIDPVTDQYRLFKFQVERHHELTAE
jgi:AMMECR1 domain-containing protein